MRDKWERQNFAEIKLFLGSFLSHGPAQAGLTRHDVIDVNIMPQDFGQVTKCPHNSDNDIVIEREDFFFF